MIDDIENLFDYYLDITFSILCTLTSCTHYTQIFAKLSTGECVYLIWPSEIIHCVMFNTFSFGLDLF